MCNAEKEEISFKILPDGRLMIERGDEEHNSLAYQVFSSHVRDKEKLRNFLFRWQDSELLTGSFDLCG